MPGKFDRRTNIQPFARAIIRKRRNLHTLAVITACLAALHVESCVNMQCFVFFNHSVDAGAVHRSKRVKCINYGNVISFQNRCVEILELGLY